MSVSHEWGMNVSHLWDVKADSDKMITHKFVGLTLPYHFRGHHAILRKYEADRNVAYFTYVMNFPCKCKGAYIRLIGLRNSIKNTRRR